MKQPDRIRITDWAYERIQSAILAEEFPPGSKLSVPALAQYLGISRSPVREAVLRLVQNGLAEETAHRGAVVPTFGASRVAQFYEVREVLEGLAAHQAATRLTQSQLDGLTAVLEEHKDYVEKGLREEFLARDARFHLIIRVATGNAALIQHLDQLQDLIRLGMKSTSVTSGPEEAIRDHESILEHLLRRDPAGAEQAAKKHIRRLRNVILESLPADTISTASGELHECY